MADDLLTLQASYAIYNKQNRFHLTMLLINKYSIQIGTFCQLRPIIFEQIFLRTQPDPP